MAFAFSDISDARTQEALSTEYLRLLADRTSLPNHPALVYAGDAAGSGSNVIRVPHWGIDGYDALAATADGSAVTPTTPTVANTDITVARYSKAYAPTDAARWTTTGDLNVERFAMDAFQSAQNKLVNLVAALGSGFSNSVGSSGVNLTAQVMLDAKRQLEVSNADGDALLAVLAPVQFADLRDDIATNVGGAIPFMPATQDMINVRGRGFVGTWAGIDIFVTSHVPTANAGADRAGCLLSRGAAVWADMTPQIDKPQDQIVMGRVLFELERSALSGLTRYVSHYHCGVSEGIDTAGCQILSDA